MGIIGYKIFNKDMTNQYGDQFEIGKHYVMTEKISFGTTGKGFHFAERLEDTLRYGDLGKLNTNCVISLVEGSGEILTRNDEYYGYYDLHCSSEITIIKILSREEIMCEVYSMPEYRQERFIQGYELTIAEQNYFKNINQFDNRLKKTVEYYQQYLPKVRKKTKLF